MIKKLLRKIIVFFTGRCLLSHDELIELVNKGVINASLSSVKGTSIDLTLHHIIRKEVMGSQLKIIRLYKGESIETVEIDLSLPCRGGEYVMMPDSVVLGSTVEVFNLPLNISSEFSLKSTLGRNFLGHELAGWIDAGFSGRVTLELKNNNQFHKLSLGAGMPIGQVKFFRHRKVQEKNSYRANGQYMYQDKVTQAKNLR